MSGNDERPIMDDGLERLRQDVATVIEVLRRADLSLQSKYSIEFLAVMAMIGGVNGTRMWIRTVARLVQEYIEEMNNNVIMLGRG